MFDGFRSRWMMPFWWACCTAWHTWTNSCSRSAMLRRAASQSWVIGTPLTYSMTKNGRPASVRPPSSTLAMLGWSISASACRSCSKRQHLPRVHPRLDELQGHLAADRLGLLGDPDGPHAALAEFF